MKRFVFSLLVLLSILSAAAGQSPYAGEEFRSIKALSPGEIESLLAGKGMGFAKAAELNHYPGPKHVLELADALRLTQAQVSATEALFADMQQSAKSLGASLLAAEQRLDSAFADGTITPEALRSALDEIGGIRTRLRYVHLEAHLRQRELLTDAQVADYDRARGYGHSQHRHGEH